MGIVGAGISYGSDYNYLYITNNTNCTMTYNSDNDDQSNMHWVSNYEPDDSGNKTIAPGATITLEAKGNSNYNTYADIEYTISGCGSDTYSTNYFKNAPLTMTLEWWLHGTGVSDPARSIATVVKYSSSGGDYDPDYFFQHNLYYQVQYGSDSNSSDYNSLRWSLNEERPDNNKYDIGVSSRYSDDGNGDPYYVASFSNVSVDEILPFNKIYSNFSGVNVNGNCPAWACTTNSTGETVTNGLYRINFSFDISPKNDSEATNNTGSHPPVIGAFQVYKVNSDGSKTLMGKVSRDYAFLYNNGTGSDGINTFSLKDTFVYDADATTAASGEVASQLEIEGGYYTSDNEFHSVASTTINLASKAIDYPVDMTYSIVGVKLNEEDVSNGYAGASAGIVNNGLQQVRLLPILDTSSQGTGKILPAQNPSASCGQDGNSPDSDCQGNLYNHMVDLSGLANDSGSELISNFQPNTNSNGYKNYSQNFETSYLKSRYYCTSSVDASNGQYVVNPGDCYAATNSANISPENNGYDNSLIYTSESYPPIVLTNNYAPPVPQYLSLRPLASSGRYNPDVCYIYYYTDSSGTSTVNEGCMSQNNQSIVLNQETGVADGMTKTSSNPYLNLGLGYNNAFNQNYVAGRVTSSPSYNHVAVDANFIDPTSTIASSSIVTTLNSAISDSNSPCYLYAFSGDSYMRSGANFVAKVDNNSSKTQHNILQLDEGLCGVFNQMLKNTNGDTLIEAVPGSTIQLKDYEGNSGQPVTLSASENSDYLNLKSGSYVDTEDYNDSMKLLKGWPVWNSWYLGTYQSSPLDKEPFMLIMNAASPTKDSQNTNNTDYRLAYNRLGYSDYSEDNLVAPFPAYATSAINRNPVLSSGNWNRGIAKGCSYLPSPDIDNVSAFLNSWCEYLGSGYDSGLIVGNHFNPSYSLAPNMKDYLPDMSDVYIVGLRDVLGDYVQPTQCSYTTDSNGNITSSSCKPVYAN